MTLPSDDTRRARVRALHRELQRIHRAEVSAARALEEIRAARSRVEELLETSDSPEGAPPLGETGDRTWVWPARDAGERPEPSPPAGKTNAGVASGAPPDSTAIRADETRRGEGGATTAPAGASRDATGGGPPAESPPPEAVSGLRGRPGREAAAGAAILVLLGLMGWWILGDRAGRGGETPAPVPVAAEGPATGAGEEGPAGGSEQGTPRDGSVDSPDPASEVEGGTLLADAPLDPEAASALMDSLWESRSPLLSPLLQEVEAATESDAVEDALERLAGDQDPGPLGRDLVRSAALQVALRRFTGEDLDIDGQVLRNPCRGRSCGMLMELWEDSASAWGLEPPGENADRNMEALGTAEAVTLLRTLRELARDSG